jgi:glycosyltransferase involved in cell wall biosynthesis
MKVLFLHNNFPGQFLHLASYLKQSGDNVVAVGGPASGAITGIRLVRYRLRRGSTPGILSLAVRYEADCLRGEAALLACCGLKAEGFCPDLVIGHSGFGELLFVKEIWPAAKTVAYAEYYYRGLGGDACFDKEIDDPSLMNLMLARAKNAGVATSVAEADLAVSPTKWQRCCFPQPLRSRIVVAHDGIDTQRIRPDPHARLQLADGGEIFGAGAEIVTYVNRNLEPMRGIHVLLRALPAILESRPLAHVFIVGTADQACYGRPPPSGTTWQNIFLEEIRGEFDQQRVHWLGRVDREWLNSVLAVSRVHVYLTYPFVLSWSLLEAMSAGCLVVASSTEPVCEVIEDRRNGLLVDFFDHRLLAKTVVELLSVPQEEFAAIKASARNTIVRRYDRDTVCLPRQVDLIQQLFAD